MDLKKIGIWGGGFIGSFIVLLILVYFLFPYLNPKKAAKIVEQPAPSVEEATFDPSRYSLQAVDSLNQQISSQQIVIDSLLKIDGDKQQLIDSMREKLETGSQKDSMSSMVAESSQQPVSAIKEAAKPLLSLEEEALAPIVDLLDERQLISLYKEGSGRQREKLLRTLKPKKAANILKKVM